MSEREARATPSRTSGAVKALRSCWVTFSSVKETLPEGMSSRDQGEMMKPRAEGSGENTNKNTKDQDWKQNTAHSGVSSA